MVRASNDARDGDPGVLFDEYVSGSLEGQPPDVDELCRRAGERSGELQRMIGVAQLLAGIREGAAEQALAESLLPRAENGPLATLGRYLELVPLGEGGLSRVFRAVDPQLRREVALKVLTLPQGQRREWVLNEGRSLARLAHPGVVKVLAVEEAEGRPFLVMDLVRGPTLREVLAAQRALAGQAESGAELLSEEARAAALRLAGIAERCELVARIAEALDYCHHNDVIHRDIKPHNVLLDAGDRPVLIDFGLAHLATGGDAHTDITQSLVGSPAYIAPEQVDSNRTGASPLSDQFSLGVLMYELLTRCHPFRLPTRTDTLTAISRAAPLLPHRLDEAIPADLERIVLHALERDPAARYPDCGALAADLRAFLAHRAISLRPPTTLQSARLFLRRNRRRVLFGTAGALGLAVIFTTLSVLRVRSEQAQVDGAIERLAASLEHARGPAAFQDIYLQLSSLRSRAEALDRSLLAGLTGTDPAAHLDAAVQETSERLGATVAAQVGGHEVSDTVGRAAVRSALLLWAPVIALDRQLCPDSPHTQGLRERGQVELPVPARPGDLLVWRLGSHRQRIIQPLREPVPAPHVLSAAEAGTGVYRVAFRDPAGNSFEVDLPLRAEDPRATLRPVGHAGLLADLVDCAGGAFELPTLAPGAMDDARVEVPAFRISRSLVSWRDVIEVWPERGQVLFDSPVNGVMRSPEAGPLDLDSPAMLPWDTALEFARHVGARLPTTLETRLAWATAELEFPSEEHGVKAEWSGDVTSVFDEMRNTTRYSARNETDWSQWTGAHPDFAFVANTAFRLALTADPWLDE